LGAWTSGGHGFSFFSEKGYAIHASVLRRKKNELSGSNEF
jgi:hypothetical protein